MPNHTRTEASNTADHATASAKHPATTHQPTANQPRKEPTGEKVDMLDVARIAQATDQRPFLMPGSIKVIAPAKVNLYLEIGSKRPDGYHNVNTVMHSLLLHDTLLMRKSAQAAQTNNGLQLSMRSHEQLPELEIPFEKNIVTKAIFGLAKAAGYIESANPLQSPLPPNKALALHIDKHIPAQGGLGGGSSNAAAALVGAAKLWGIAPEDPLILDVAKTLGADVPFFLYGGCVLLTGVGDAFQKTLKPGKDPLVIIKPAGGVSTVEAYRSFDESPQVIASEHQNAALQASAAGEVPLQNNLTPASLQLNSGIKEVLEWAQAQKGAQQAMMAGSGAAVFALCDSQATAMRMVSAARNQGWWARSTSLSNLRAMVVPNH